MGRFKQWLTGLIGIDEIEEECDAMEADEMQSSEASPPFLRENTKRPNPPRPLSIPSISTRMPLSIYEPIEFSDCRTIAEKFKANEAIVVNYNMMTKNEALKIFYFLSGCVYTLDGTSERISTNIYLYTPKTIGVQDTLINDPIFKNTISFSWGNSKK